MNQYGPHSGVTYTYLTTPFFPSCLNIIAEACPAPEREKKIKREREREKEEKRKKKSLGEIKREI